MILPTAMARVRQGQMLTRIIYIFCVLGAIIAVGLYWYRSSRSENDGANKPGLCYQGLKPSHNVRDLWRLALSNFLRSKSSFTRGLPNCFMESLLRWSIENSTNENGSGAPQPPPRDISKLDPGIIDMILGRPDSEKMKEALAVAQDESVPESARLVALDDFEMLIEQIDNANSITSMNMWEPLIALLSSPSDAIQMNALWILGTAIQNNPSSQNAFLSHSPLAKVLFLMQANLIDHTPQTRAKAVYCLSGLLRHNRAAVEQLEALEGWQAFKGGLTDPDNAVRRKVAFLLNSLLLPDGDNPNQVLTTTTQDLTRDAISKHGIVNSLVTRLVDPPESGQADEEFEEKSAAALLSYLDAGGSLENKDKAKMSAKMDKPHDTAYWGLVQEERDRLRSYISS